VTKKLKPNSDPTKLRHEILAKFAADSDKPEHEAMRLVERILTTRSKDGAAEAMMDLLLAFNKGNAADRNSMILFAIPIAMLHHSDWMDFYESLNEGMRNSRAYKKLKAAARKEGAQ